MSALLLRGGRVVDPGTGSDRIADVLIEDGRIAAVGPGLQHDDALVVDVTGKVVGPGFVDLHSHVNSIAGQRLQAMDGVTTALELEAGLLPVEIAYARALEEGRPINFGFSASWGMARAEVLSGRAADADFVHGLSMLADPAWQGDSSPAQLRAWLGRLEGELADGALGIGILQGYAPRTDPAEYRAVNELAARAGAPTFTHVREIVEADPTTPVDGTVEAARVAMDFGGQVHHCHVNSTSRRHIDRVLQTIEDARAGGAAITVESYPYGAGSTGIGAAFLAPERLAIWGLTPSSIVLVATGERIRDAAHLRHVRATDPGAACIVEFLDEHDPVDTALLEQSLAFPDAIVASDAMHVTWPDGSVDTREWPLPPGGMTHPRTAGTYARSLRTMVRERGLWTWLEAFRRCSYLPSRVLDRVAPAFERKGHLGVGADADIAVVDPERVTDRATYFDGTRTSLGIDHVLVAGEFVVRDGDIVLDAYPGRGLRGVLR
ncbi:dihydroorotase-like cyclic amidohydrolase [Microcella alkaliphila]|uniref:Dihydroorotase-like cyclic amidohydrolase n=1 Tax=Microcella alkaliphila TaxID=279828 RepID=A0A4Q7U114_9MICO|nr:amidohydrolase family protein [Microcella alkaliphila]RZT66450.1 dihydroorotase-like cyclic amidohydrolase [Microcella alkaliphila]